MIRAFSPADLDELARLHGLYFGDEFDLPDFLNYICAYVVTDDQTNEIITIGGLRSITECVTITDKSRSPTERIKALYQILHISEFVARKSGYDQIYVWSQNPQWARRLRKNGFKIPLGQSLILDL